jgi:hypothetical protein
LWRIFEEVVMNFGGTFLELARCSQAKPVVKFCPVCARETEHQEYPHPDLAPGAHPKREKGSKRDWEEYVCTVCHVGQRVQGAMMDLAAILRELHAEISRMGEEIRERDERLHVLEELLSGERSTNGELVAEIRKFRALIQELAWKRS